VGAVRRHISESLRVAPDDVPKTVIGAVICYHELLRRGSVRYDLTMMSKQSAANKPDRPPLVVDPRTANARQGRHCRRAGRRLVASQGRGPSQLELGDIVK